ncbi:FHA domain-containing protein [Myxococcus stipitatus]|uniref:FHA domain-containing protein n=1 Tax=Myxococcus stipitatus TaxID=83455 RepID=UPI001F204C51|nr:FHA domain-containing protein [Myxococcus stipitatus]MCE9666828.1 FHA domain-containing protein [Myxococcus stipitatus]
MELPFDDDEVAPLQADDPRPQRVPQFPAGSRKRSRQGSGRGRDRDRELSAKFEWGREYSNPGHPPAFLYVERGPGAGQLVPVQQGPLVLGRSSSSDLRLQHPSISRRHAQLTRQGDDYFLKDLGSQNGTFLNRVRVVAEVPVMPGDEISLGNAVLRLRGPGTPSSPHIPAPLPAVAPEPAPRPRMKRLTVALIAAGMGSAVAALFTVLVVGLSSSPGVKAPPSTNEGGAAQAGQPETPLLVDAPPSRRPGDSRPHATASRMEDAPSGAPRAQAAADSRQDEAGEPGARGARDLASGGRSQAGAGGASARDIASGRSGAATSSPTTPSAPSAADIASGRVASGAALAQGGPSAAGIASGRGQAPSTERSGGTAVSAADIATRRGTGTGSAVSRSGGAETSVRAGPTPAAMPSTARGAPAAEDELSGTGLAPMQTRETRPAVQPGTEADVMRRYESDDVTGAVEMARVSKLPALQARLQRIESFDAEARKARAKGDLPRAISQLTAAVDLDQELSHGWGDPRKRFLKQLVELHVQAGTTAMKAGDTNGARDAFQKALQHDSGNRIAREGLRRLDAAQDR